MNEVHAIVDGFWDEVDKIYGSYQDSLSGFNKIATDASKQESEGQTKGKGSSRRRKRN